MPAGIFRSRSLRGRVNTGYGRKERMVYMESFVDNLIFSGHFEAYKTLKDLDPLQRVDLICKWFDLACEKNNDEKGQLFLDWLIQAWVDSDENRSYLSLGSCRAKAVQKMYFRIPVSNGVSFWMPNTKEKALLSISTCYHSTKNEEEADELFDFLCSLKPSYDNEEIKMHLDIFRKATEITYLKSGSPSDSRLLRHFLRIGLDYTGPNLPPYKFANHYDYLVNGGEIFLHAWIKSKECKDTSQILRVIAPLMEYSTNGVFIELKKCVDVILNAEKACSPGFEYEIRVDWQMPQDR